MESLCGLERGCYVQRGPTPRRGSYKYWQIDSHVTPHPSCSPLCLLGPTLSKSHLHLSHRGCVLDHRGFTLRYVFFLSLVTPSFLPALPSSLCFYNPCWLQPRVVALLPPTYTQPQPFLELSFPDLQSFPLTVVGTGKRAELLGLEASKSIRSKV